MAKSSRPAKARKKTSPPAEVDPIDDAVPQVVADTVDEGTIEPVEGADTEKLEADEASDTPDPEASAEDPVVNEDPSNDTDPIEDTAVETDQPDEYVKPSEDIDPADPPEIHDREALDQTPVSKPITPSQTPQRGFLPLALGGLAAGAIGFGIATFAPMSGANTSTDLTAQLTQQAEDIAALQAQLADSPITDLSAIAGQIDAVSTQTADQIAALSESMTAQLTTFEARLTELEKRPNADGTLSDIALAAYQRELEQLRADLDAQQATVMSAAAQAEADLATARQEAARLEQAAIAQAEAAAARAAINRVAAAVETGAPFADALSDLDGATLPTPLLEAAQTGVATTASLVADFPEAARAALATARAEGVSDDAGGLSGFLRSQFDVRSTAPREGSGPDAVLSRAEAAVKEGRIADALTEMDALPDVARAELTDWTARAAQRAAVLDALATLSETYN